MAERKGVRREAERLVGRAKGVVTDVIGRATAKAGAQTAASFIRNVAISDRYEIEAAELALERAQSPRVKEIAQQMMRDHTTSTHQLKSALRMNETRGESSPPERVDERRQKWLDELRKAPDGDFDETYLEQQVAAHKEVVELLSSYRDRGDNPQLRSLAAGAAPVVERHLRHVQELRGELAG